MKEYEDIASRNGYMHLYSLKECNDKDIRYEVFDKEHRKHHKQIFTLRRSDRKNVSKDIRRESADQIFETLLFKTIIFKRYHKCSIRIGIG